MKISGELAKKSRSRLSSRSSLLGEASQNLQALLVAPSVWTTRIIRLGAQAFDSDCFKFLVSDSKRNEIVPIPWPTGPVDKILDDIGHFISGGLPPEHSDCDSTPGAVVVGETSAALILRVSLTARMGCTVEEARAVLAKIHAQASVQ